VALATDREIVSCKRNNPALIHNHTKPEQVSTKTFGVAEAIRADIGHYSSRRSFPTRAVRRSPKIPFSALDREQLDDRSRKRRHHLPIAELNRAALGSDAEGNLWGPSGRWVRHDHQGVYRWQ
jgi:hypothetical protein